MQSIYQYPSQVVLAAFMFLDWFSSYTYTYTYPHTHLNSTTTNSQTNLPQYPSPFPPPCPIHNIFFSFFFWSPVTKSYQLRMLADAFV
jgi:hypothetical protein